jgi:GR25 family glycosyltransferase involved in LPS biosynthesis
MKFTHKVFHIKNQNDRDHLVNNMNNYLKSYSTELDTPTIKISSKDEYLNFIKNNPSFVVDSNGYSLDGEQGWRYGEIGIWASNRTAWNNFLETDAEYLILMEDDIVYSRKFIDILKDSISQIPEKLDILHLFAPEDQFYKYNHTHDFGAKDVCYPYQDWSCLCYIITRQGAQKLLESSNCISLPLDWHMFRQTHLFNIFTLKPESSIACSLFPIESTFQTKQKREILNGIL